MDVLVSILICFVPMALAQATCILVDRDGEKTSSLVQRFPVLKQHKFLIQIGGMVVFVVVFGLLSIAFNFPKEVFYAVSGFVIGAINGIAVNIMKLE